MSLYNPFGLDNLRNLQLLAGTPAEALATYRTIICQPCVHDGGLAELKTEIDALAKDPNTADLLPDVEIDHKAVRYAVEYDEIYIDKNRNDVNVSKALLKKGM